MDWYQGSPVRLTSHKKGQIKKYIQRERDKYKVKEKEIQTERKVDRKL